ncbi:MAG: hypothetical protein AAF821_19790 [Cyanobacteria bacterium P01_D01_bin.156]
MFLPVLTFGLLLATLTKQFLTPPDNATKNSPEKHTPANPPNPIVLETGSSGSSVKVIIKTRS